MECPFGAKIIFRGILAHSPRSHRRTNITIITLQGAAGACCCSFLLKVALHQLELARAAILLLLLLLLLLCCCRSVHVAVHRMMLQLLRRFPGSYLIRAQAGELRYLAAFTSPSTAAAWCLTVQVRGSSQAIVLVCMPATCAALRHSRRQAQQQLGASQCR
jgi:hypothetical protein